MLVQLQVGQQNSGKGANPTARGGVQGDVIVSELHGRYAESNVNGNIFHATNTGVGITLAAANAIGAAVPAAGAAQPILGLVNPSNSGVYLVVNRAKVLTLSGTPGGGFVFGFLNNQAGQYTGVVTNKGVQGSTLQTGGKAIVVPNLALTGTTNLVSELRQIGGPAAVAAGAGVYTVEEETAGDILVPPGAILGIFAQAAGTTHIVKASLTWEEFTFNAAL
jgi:hypothetical protein